MSQASSSLQVALQVFSVGSVVADVTGKERPHPKGQGGNCLGRRCPYDHGVGIYQAFRAQSALLNGIRHSLPADNKAVLTSSHVQWKDVYRSQLELAEEG